MPCTLKRNKELSIKTSQAYIYILGRTRGCIETDTKILNIIIGNFGAKLGFKMDEKKKVLQPMNKGIKVAKCLRVAIWCGEHPNGVTKNEKDFITTTWSIGKPFLIAAKLEVIIGWQHLIL